MPDSAQHRLRQFIPELVRIVRTALRPSMINIAVASNALSALGNAFSTMDPIPAVRDLLVKRKVVSDATTIIATERKNDEEEEEKKKKTMPKQQQQQQQQQQQHRAARGSIMCSPAPAIFAPEVPQSPEEGFLREIMTLCGGPTSSIPSAASTTPSGGLLLRRTHDDPSPPSNSVVSSPPLYPDLPIHGLTVLAKISKRYPSVVLDRWDDVVPTLLSSIKSLEDRVRVLGLNVLTILVQGTSMTPLSSYAPPLSSSSHTQEEDRNGVVSFIATHLPRAFSDSKSNVRAAACGVMANVHESQWNMMKSDVREHFFGKIIEMSYEGGARGKISGKLQKVHMAGCMGVGRIASLPAFYINPTHIRNALQRMSSILSHENQVVGARAAWAFANIVDVAGPTKHSYRPFVECPLSILRKEEMKEERKRMEDKQQEQQGEQQGEQEEQQQKGQQQQYLCELTDVALRASGAAHSTGNGVKMCASAIRALGSIGQFWLKDVGTLIEKSNGDPDQFMQLSSKNPSIDMASSVMDALCTCLSNPNDHEKLLWNACHAIGRILGSFGAYDTNDHLIASIRGGRRTEEEEQKGNKEQQQDKGEERIIVTGVASAWIVEMSWYDQLLRSLSNIAATCPNFKVRIHAVQAIGRRCTGRKDYGDENLMSHVLCQLVESYMTMDDVTDPNMDYRFQLREDLSVLITRMVYLVDPVKEMNSEGGGPVSIMFAKHASLFKQLIKERDRASGLSMISSDKKALHNPANESIVQEAIAVQRQYHRLSTQLGALSTKVRRKGAGEWGDDECEEGGDDGEENVDQRVVAVRANVGGALAVQKECAKRSMEILALLRDGRMDDDGKDGKEEKRES